MRRPKDTNEHINVNETQMHLEEPQDHIAPDQGRPLQPILEENLRLASRRRAKAKEWEWQFNRYVQLEQKRLHALAWQITGCWHAAEDATQDTFIALYRRLLDKGLDGNISAWLTRVTTNNALQFLRRQKKSKTVSLTNAAESIPAPPDDCPLEQRETLAQAQESIDQLPDQQRRVFVLRLLEEWDYEKIAQELNILPATAKSCFYKARTNVKAERGQ